MAVSSPTLRPYQIIGRNFMASRNVALLADGMRLGKSAQVIRAFESLGLTNILIICPASARYVWANEIQKWGLRRHTVHIGYPSVKLAPKLDGICIAGYTRPEDDLIDQDWDLVVLDECHYLKNANSQRTQKIYRIIKHAPRVWWLSGTPMLSHGAELWPMLRMAGRCTYTYGQFIQKFCNGYQPAKGKFRVTGHKRGAEQEIKNMLDGFMLRRTMKEVIPELPTVQTNFYPVEKFKGAEFDANEDAYIGQRTREFGAMADTSVATWRRMTGLAKVKGVLETVKHDLANGMDKLVLFAWHKEVMEQLWDGLASYGPVMLSGSTPPSMREYAVRLFTELPPCRVFIGNIQAASEAIDLSVACNVGFVELDWTPARNDQAAARVLGMNQKHPVDIRIFTLEDSADQIVARAILRKSKNLKEVL